MGDETWECDAQRIYFYDLTEANMSLVQQMMAREKNTDAGGHGWDW